MNGVESFLTADETALCESFLGRGYVIIEAEDRPALERISSLVATAAANHLKVTVPEDRQEFFNRIHETVAVETLNGLRLAIIGTIGTAEGFRSDYFALVRNTLATLVGNELAMQRGIGLSVQLPGDDSSLLQIHADVWDGDSPFEVVVWLPLVDCYRSKSMYLLDLKHDRALQAALPGMALANAEAIFEAAKDKVTFPDVRYGQALIFSQTLMHGNRINREPESRWSLNCRFKSLLSPYADKKIGEFFTPITLRPATRLGIDYRMPEAFNE